MRARLVVFPIKGRNFCFSKSVDPAAAGSESVLPPPKWRDLWKKINFSGRSMPENAEIAADFVSNKMNRAWLNLEKAPAGTMKSKIHGLGLRLLSRVPPSEVFLKSISKEIDKLDIIYPTSLNPRLVRRRIRHVALRGSIIHRKYFYGSLSLLPFTTALSVLPLPNIPFFWILFRAYSHWLALKGSERLLLMVSDGSNSLHVSISNDSGNRITAQDNSKHTLASLPGLLWDMQPSEELERLSSRVDEDSLKNCVVSTICKTYNLDEKEVVKYRDSL